MTETELVVPARRTVDPYWVGCVAPTTPVVKDDLALYESGEDLEAFLGDYLTFLKDVPQDTYAARAPNIHA